MIDSRCDVAGQTPVNVVQKYYKERGNLLELLQPRGWNACAFFYIQGLHLSHHPHCHLELNCARSVAPRRTEILYFEFL